MIKELPEKISWPDVLENDLPSILFNTTSLPKVKKMVENCCTDVEASFLYRQIDNEFSESVYLYNRGMLHNTLDMNENVEQNIAAFLNSYSSGEKFTLVSESDQKMEHVPVDD